MELELVLFIWVILGVIGVLVLLIYVILGSFFVLVLRKLGILFLGILVVEPVSAAVLVLHHILGQLRMNIRDVLALLFFC